MEVKGKATSLWSNFFKLGMPQMRAFHMSWFAFFLCFFAWFGIAPLMTVVRDELSLSKEQIGWCIIASVSITIVARLFIGWLCDRIGPRLAYSGLLMLGALPVMGIAFANDFTSFLIFRLLIGIIGASFVITQYHTSIMFAPNCVGTANATSAGWGNLGGGATQFAMPLLFAGMMGMFGLLCGFSDGAGPTVASWLAPICSLSAESFGWRAAMIASAVVCFLTGIAYFFFTQDTPEGNFSELRAAGKLPEGRNASFQFWSACRDYRVWALFFIYGACFGIELTINNIAALYFADQFGLGLVAAGFTAASFGFMNIFARTLGGAFGDKFGGRWGLKGRVMWLFLALFCEGLALMLFSQMSVLVLALPALIVFSLFVQMSEGATYSVVPFINRKALGAVAGIVGAGGNAGAVAAGFLFKTSAITWPTALLILGAIVTCCSTLTFLVRFSPQSEGEAQHDLQAAKKETRKPEPVLQGVS